MINQCNFFPSLQWLNAVDLVRGGREDKFLIENPQLLELGKLGNMSWTEIVSYSFERYTSF